MYKSVQYFPSNLRRNLNWPLFVVPKVFLPIKMYKVEYSCSSIARQMYRTWNYFKTNLCGSFSDRLSWNRSFSFLRRNSSKKKRDNQDATSVQVSCVWKSVMSNGVIIHMYWYDMSRYFIFRPSLKKCLLGNATWGF